LSIGKMARLTKPKRNKREGGSGEEKKISNKIDSKGKTPTERKRSS